MAKKNEQKNRANKKLHTKLLKRKKAKQQDAKEKRAARLKEIAAQARKNREEEED